MTRKTTIFVSLGLAILSMLIVMLGSGFFLSLLYDHHDRIAPGGFWENAGWTHISPVEEMSKLIEIAAVIAFVPLCVGLGTLGRRSFSACQLYGGHDFVRAWLIAICATPLVIWVWTLGLDVFYRTPRVISVNSLDGLDALGFKTALYALGCGIVVLGIVGRWLQSEAELEIINHSGK